MLIIPKKHPLSKRLHEQENYFFMDNVRDLDIAKCDQWLIWKFNDDGRKVPLNKHGLPSGVDRDYDFMSFEEAVEASEKWASVQGPCFVFTGSDGFFGIDLDDCCQPATYKKLEDPFLAIAERANSYTETSPSLSGAKIICRGELPPGTRNRFPYGSGEVEMYDGKSGRRFFTITGVSLDQFPAKINDFDPAELLEEIAPPKVTYKTVPYTGSGTELEERVRSYLSGIMLCNGSRNNTIFSASGHIRSLVDEDGRGLPDPELLGLLREWNSLSSDGVSDDELIRTATSAWKNGTPRDLKRPNERQVIDGSDVDLSGIMQMVSRPTDVTVSASGEPALNEALGASPNDLAEITPIDLEAQQLPELPDVELPGLLGRVYRFINEGSLYPQPQLAFGSVFALMSMLVARKFKTITGVRGNLYVIGIAPSGAGKDDPLKMPGRILAACGNAGISMIAPRSMASGASVNAWMSKKPAALWAMDEVGYLFASIRSQAEGKSGNSFLSQIPKALLEYWSAAGDRCFFPTAYSDRKQTDELMMIHPYLSVWGMATPDSFFNGMTKASLADGLMARMFLVYGRYCESVDVYEERDIPEDIIEECRQWVDFEAENDLGMPREKVVGFTPEAERRATSHRKAIERKRMTEDMATAAVWSRAHERAIKFALLICCSRHSPTDEMAISLEDVEMGILLADSGTRNLTGQAHRVGSTAYENNQMKVWEYIAESANGRSRSEVSRKFRNLKKKERDALLDDLREQGRVKAMDVKSGTNTKRVYYAMNRD